jgi:UDPglucose 6-dehydrogenase
VRHGEIQFIAVGTPPGEDGSADLSHVLAAARNIGRHMDGFKVVVDKSTVPVGTADRVGRPSPSGTAGARRTARRRLTVVSNPSS